MIENFIHSSLQEMGRKKVGETSTKSNLPKKTNKASSLSNPTLQSIDKFGAIH